MTLRDKLVVGSVMLFAIFCCVMDLVLLVLGP